MSDRKRVRLVTGCSKRGKALKNSLVESKPRRSSRKRSAEVPDLPTLAKNKHFRSKRVCAKGLSKSTLSRLTKTVKESKMEADDKTAIRRGPDLERRVSEESMEIGFGKEDDDTHCVICMSDIMNKKTLEKCEHSFCLDCIDQWFRKSNPICPSCGAVYGVITGNQPDGHMDHCVISDMHLPGFEKHGCIQLNYSFPDGIQTQNHPNPGCRYSGTYRTAYLPASREGWKVLHLLEKAFKRRLVFTIGRSVTTGCDNVVIWNDIHHKTNVTGGATSFGYPDPTYLNRVQQELASKGITDQ